MISEEIIEYVAVESPQIEISDINCPDEFYPPEMNIDNNKLSFTCAHSRFSFAEYLPMDSISSEDDPLNEIVKEQKKSIANLTNFYVENFSEYPKSKASGEVVTVKPHTYSNHTHQKAQKSIEYYKKQYNLFKRNHKIKNAIYKFHYSVLYSNLNLTNASPKKKISYFKKKLIHILWNLNKLLYIQVKKRNLFPTDSSDMIEAVKLGVQGKLTGDMDFSFR